jgi:L-rhamnonate dehydratase|tara:strand:- start:13607 stop:14680 length:1074 start_codon:yes stop_codon:yes gene_type:complete
MKITKIEVVYPSYQDSLRAWRPNLWQIITKINTDRKQIIGYGTGGGGNSSLEVIVGHLSELIIGKTINNTEDIQKIFDYLYAESIPYGRGGIASMAISAIDLALWDAYSKYYKIPIKKLLEKNENQHNDKINTYATGNNIDHYNELGLNNFKLSVRSDGDYEKESNKLYELISTIRKKYNNTNKIMLDCYMSWDIDYTKKISKKLKDLKIEWLEDVSTPETMLFSPSIINDLNGIKLAGGEHDLNYNNFKLMKKNKTYHLWQPDITWCGGISSLLKIININKKKYKIFLHRGGEPWGLPLIESGVVDNMAELHNPKSKNLQMEQWNNKTIKSLEDGILITDDYLGFGANPIKGLFND